MAIKAPSYKYHCNSIILHAGRSIDAPIYVPHIIGHGSYILSSAEVDKASDNFELLVVSNWAITLLGGN